MFTKYTKTIAENDLVIAYMVCIFRPHTGIALKKLIARERGNPERSCLLDVS
jgi:hypothetical protein